MKILAHIFPWKIFNATLPIGIRFQNAYQETLRIYTEFGINFILSQCTNLSISFNIASRNPDKEQYMDETLSVCGKRFLKY